MTGSGHPTVGFVYKLVAVAGDDTGSPMHAVAKRSAGKATIGGRKCAYRVLDDDGYAIGEYVAPVDAAASAPVLGELRPVDRSVLAGPPALSAAPGEQRGALQPVAAVPVAT